MTPSLPHYPWFAVVSGVTLEQGDVLQECPCLELAWSDLALADLSKPVPVELRFRDVIIMTQSCDLERSQPPSVLLCDIVERTKFPASHKLSKSNNLEIAEKGHMPAFHVVAESTISGFERDVSVVDFQRVHSLPFEFVKREAERRLHLRLLPRIANISHKLSLDSSCE